MLAAALRECEVSLVSLQVGHGQDQIADLPAGQKPFDPFADLPAGDFASTAAVIANMDLVVTVDTAVAHLAGAMGRPTWVLLPHVADWRWLREREDSPWYPTMRLFRQHRVGDWTYAFARLTEALRRWR
jgi:ADP-heptose:LPS heptosyltransferase